MKRHLKKIIVGVIALSALAAGVDFLIHHYDPTRVVYKRLKAADKYVYDEIDPKFRQTDPSTLIAIETAADADAARARLIDAIWGGGGFPGTLSPARVERGIDDPVPGALPNLARIDRVTVDMGGGVRSFLYHLRPAARRKNRLVIYHHGFAGAIQDVPETLGAFLERGYAVLGVNLMAYGGNSAYLSAANGDSYNLHFDLDRIENPLRYHFEPVVVGINYLLRDFDYQSIDMVGFSAGGFVAIVAAAIDPRIRRSYPIAGAYPIYLRVGQDIQNGMPSTYPPLLAAASYLDMFILGATGAGRRQMQVFNRYDRCCNNNTKAMLYAPAVAARAAALGGAFAVLIDETHADHKFSRFARDAVLADMARYTKER
jgi:dienelactone hydrolase